MPRFAFALLALLLLASGAVAQRSVPAPRLPSITRPWNLADAREAAAALHWMAYERPDSLPHYSVSSRSIFGRLTAPGVLTAPDTSAEARLLYYDQAVQVYEQIFLLYARLQAQRGGYDTDLAELAGVLLRATGSTAQALGAMRAAQPDTNRADFEEATALLSAGMAQTVMGVLEMATDPMALSPEARHRLLRHTLQSGALIASALSDAQRTGITARLGTLQRRADLKELGDELQALEALFASG